MTDPDLHFVLDLRCETAAFTHETNDERHGERNPGPEVARILRRLADELEGNPDFGANVLRDVNGHVVGSARFEERPA